MLASSTSFMKWSKIRLPLFEYCNFRNEHNLQVLHLRPFFLILKRSSDTFFLHVEHRMVIHIHECIPNLSKIYVLHFFTFLTMFPWSHEVKITFFELSMKFPIFYVFGYFSSIPNFCSLRALILVRALSRINPGMYVSIYSNILKLFFVKNFLRIQNILSVFDSNIALWSYSRKTVKILQKIKCLEFYEDSEYVIFRSSIYTLEGLISILWYTMISSNLSVCLLPP